MAKQSGLGDALYIDGYDLSGKTNSVALAAPQATIDDTDITQFGTSRIGGKRDGTFNWVSFFDPGAAADAAHTVLSVLPTTDGSAIYCRGTTLGSPAAALIGKQIDYPGDRGADGSFTFKMSMAGNGFAMEWGNLATAGKRTDAAATNGTALDGGGGFTTPAVPASLTPVTNTSGLTATVVITGGTMTNVSVNGVTVGAGAGTYTVPAGGTITLTYTVAPTWTWTPATAFGCQAYLQVFAFTGTDVTIKLQDSADNSTFTDLAGATFGAITSTTPQGLRIGISNTATVRRYVRVSTTTSGGFTSCTYAVAFVRNPIAGQVF
jgi:hypothetical protein